MDLFHYYTCFLLSILFLVLCPYYDKATERLINWVTPGLPKLDSFHIEQVTWSRSFRGKPIKTELFLAIELPYSSRLLKLTLGLA